MAIARYENITVNTVTLTQTEFGEPVTSVAKAFDTRALVGDVSSAVAVSEKYRVYSDLVNFTLNYTPNTRAMVDNQQAYAIAYRGKDWRITDCRESNDRMRVTFLCYRNDPAVAV